MTKVSRIAVAPKSMGLFVDNFRSAVTRLANKDEVKQFFYDLLTPTESKMLAKRLQLAKMLLEGYDYRAIQNYVKVTPGTIAKINNQLALSGSGLRKAIEQLWKTEQERERKLMQMFPSWSDLKKKYPLYFLPEIMLDELAKIVEREKKKRSASDV